MQMQRLVNEHPNFKLTTAGHSNVRRMRDSLVPKKARRHGKLGQLYIQNTDVSPSDPTRAAEFAKRLKLDKVISHVYTVTNGYHGKCVFLNQLIAEKRAIENTDPHILLVDSGANDIANLPTFQPDTATYLATQMYSFVSSFNDIRLIIVNAIIPRANRLAGSKEVFWSNASEYNKKLESLLEKEDYMVFNGMPGLRYLDINGKKFPKPTEEILTDGIHPKPELYHKNIQRTVLKYKAIAEGEKKWSKKKKTNKKKYTPQTTTYC